MFEINCLKCGDKVTFKDGLNDESQITIYGQPEALFDVEVYIECKCGNEITIEKG